MSEHVTPSLATDAAGPLGAGAARLSGPAPARPLGAGAPRMLGTGAAHVLGTGATRLPARGGPKALAHVGVDRVPDVLLKTQRERQDNSDSGITRRWDCDFSELALIGRCPRGPLRRGAL